MGERTGVSCCRVWRSRHPSICSCSSASDLCLPASPPPRLSSPSQLPEGVSEQQAEAAGHYRRQVDRISQRIAGHKGEPGRLRPEVAPALGCVGLECWVVPWAWVVRRLQEAMGVHVGWLLRRRSPGYVACGDDMRDRASGLSAPALVTLATLARVLCHTTRPRPTPPPACADAGVPHPNDHSGDPLHADVKQLLGGSYVASGAQVGDGRAPGRTGLGWAGLGRGLTLNQCRQETVARQGELQLQMRGWSGG